MMPRVRFLPVLALLVIITLGYAIISLIQMNPKSAALNYNLVKTSSGRDTHSIKPLMTATTKNETILPLLTRQKPPTSAAQHSAARYSNDTDPKWKFKDSGLSESDLMPYLKVGKLSKIYFFDEHKTHMITPTDHTVPSDTNKLDDQESILFISSEKKVQSIAASRRFNMNHLNHKERSSEYNDSDLLKYNQLSQTSYLPLDFIPGVLDDRHTRIRVPSIADILRSMSLIDFSMNQIAPYDSAEISRNKTNVLTFGHGGQLILAIQENGFIANGKGPDFAIFENVIETLSSNGQIEYFQEFAKVGVSEGEGQPIHWFPCNPKANVLMGCAGAVPSSKGGDLFDLSAVGVKSARMIFIVDVGYNYNKGGDQNEGFDFDGAKIYRAYQDL